MAEELLRANINMLALRMISQERLESKIGAEFLMAT